MPPSPSSTYTSIPLSPADVISRSIHNLTAAVSRRRPWSEFAASGEFGRPESITSVFIRARTNFRYFFVNYSLVVGACAALALIGSPVALLVVGAIVAFWLLFHYFREDPLILWGFQVGDRMVVVFLALASVWAVWFTSSAVSLAVGVSVGLLLCAFHAAFRKSDGLFLDEDDAVAGGLIGSDCDHRSRNPDELG
ncbi:PREDICTED: PRA1 family protein G2 [Tarenaya hassleriana]|uniref:PRA1 family protein G2 n=1 Tax=Tarenaya hassleriana TaxID=28532 RepID=UPI00053C092B|nr:PREDICTED: PRA1 family protein G2 [Tarenaya hassleriana]XP_010539359.1 PREDICTED: PRA1 family protein G2 [Tarenaya hassleriana]